MVKFRIRTTPPKGRRTWEPDTASKVQADLFAAVARLAAESTESERLLMEAIAAAKAEKAAHAA